MAVIWWNMMTYDAHFNPKYGTILPLRLQNFLHLMILMLWGWDEISAAIWDFRSFP
jgi:hypothetical protein